jgi:hypothetical protein
MDGDLTDTTNSPAKPGDAEKLAKRRLLEEEPNAAASTLAVVNSGSLADRRGRSFPSLLVPPSHNIRIIL